MSPARRTAQAIDALRHGWAISVEACDGVLHLLPVETAIDLPDSAALLISAARADTLKLTNQKAAAVGPDAPVLMSVPGELTRELALALADPALDLRHPMKGPFVAEELAAQNAAIAAMDLARRAGILPAFHVLPQPGEDAVVLSAEDMADYAAPGNLQIASRARLPVEAHENAQIAAFRSTNDLREHIALIIGTRNESTPLVRLHSECLTGDILGSLKCDCGPQLHEAMAQMANSGWGILLYLRQEGRGIGLINKLRAYELQDQGYDTVDANNRLGLPTEARDFAIAAQMLKLLHVPRVDLLTNNPEKVEALRAHGIDVAERKPLRIAANVHNERYLDTKKRRTGHQL